MQGRGYGVLKARLGDEGAGGAHANGVVDVRMDKGEADGEEGGTCFGGGKGG